MSNSVAPESSSRGDHSAKQAPEKVSISAQLVADMSPKISFHEEPAPRVHVNDFTSGEIFGSEATSKLPPLKGKESAFIPLHLAKEYVRKMENDMKSMHSHYKDMLSELEKCYAGIESDIHKKYKDFIQKYKAKMDEKCKNLKKAYDEEHKLREELRAWAEVNVVDLKEKLKEEGENKKKALEKLDSHLAEGDKEKEKYKKSLEVDYQDKIEKMKSEKAVAENNIVALNEKMKGRAFEVSRLVVEIIVQKAEFILFKEKPEIVKKDQKKKPEKPAVLAVNKENDLKLLESELEKQKNLNSNLKKDIENLKVALSQPRPAEIDPNILKENEKLKESLQSSKLKHKEKISSVKSERDNLKNELLIYTQKISAPSEDDDPEKQLLKGQIATISAEISKYRQKLSEEEGKSSQVETLKSSLAEKDREIFELKSVASKPVIISNDQGEVERLKKQIEELTSVSSVMVSAKPGDDKEKKELKSLIKKLQKQNDFLKAQADEFKVEDFKILRESLEQANSRIKYLESAPQGLDKETGSSDLENQLLLANQQIAFLKGQLSGDSFPTDDLSRLNQELLAANAKVAELQILASSAKPDPALHKELEQLRQENKSLKSNDKSSEIHSLQEELKKRPTGEELVKLSEIIKTQEKQLKDMTSSQSQQAKTLTDQLALAKQTLDQTNKDNTETLAKMAKDHSDAQNKLQKQISDLDSARKQLESQVTSEQQSKVKLTAELEQVRKVAGEADSLKKKVEELSVALAALQEKNAAKEQELKDSIRQRKLLHNQLEDLKGKIRVFCRVRPLSKSESERGCSNITTVVDDFTITCESKNGVKPFVYDSVFGPNSSQDDVFEDTKRVVQSAVDGYNVCVFAYGQTGSGKTFTMTGVPGNPGVTPRAMEELFIILRSLPNHYKWEVTCYMVEIYLDSLVDLFLPKDLKGNPPALTIKKDTKGTVNIPEAVKIEVKNAKEIMARFDEGNSMRHTSSTKMNDMSSRSHLIFGVMIDVTNCETNQRTVGKLSLVDLAGSERVSKTEATAERLKEGRAINKSLTALGDVISALSSNESHIPYRNNKLTMLMSDSLGGTAKTLMFVNISPANYNQEETLMSLFYAARVKLITNDPSKNIESKEMSNMKSELFAVTAERDKLKLFLEKKGISLNGLNELVESKPEDFDDPKYDDL